MSKSRIFNSVRCNCREIRVDVDLIDLNEDNPRTKEEQEQNGLRMEKVYLTHSYKESEPMILLPVGKRFKAICGTGRTDGIQRLKISNPERFTELFGKAGTVLCYVLDDAIDDDVVRIMSDHSGIDPMKL